MNAAWNYRAPWWLPGAHLQTIWPALAALFDWIERDGPSAAFSCLGAHAAVLHFDGIERRRLPEKRCGLFEHAVVDFARRIMRHQATVGVQAKAGERWRVSADSDEPASLPFLTPPMGGAVYT